MKNNKNENKRLTNTIKYWIENYWFDFSDDERRKQQLTTFVNETIKDQPKLQKQLTRVLERKVNFLKTFK